MSEPLTAVVAETALGWAGVALSPAGIRRATLFHQTREACAAELAAHGAVEREDPRAGDVADRLVRYALGEGPLLDDYPVDLPPCSPMQRDTWLALRTIPYGETRSYGWLAREIGRPGKARPVGSINGTNPIPLWLPCHRVIGADGSLVGYGGGLELKRRLLEVEGALSRPLL
jgi:O-6-methylguanine DNA methyltransferase